MQLAERVSSDLFYATADRIAVLPGAYLLLIEPREVIFVWLPNFNFEGGDQRIFRINDDVYRFSLNFKTHRKLHLCSPLSTFNR